MTEKEALKIVSSTQTQQTWTASGLEARVRAEGYLEAIEKVKGLVEALNKMILMHDAPKEYPCAPHCNACIRQATLAKWEAEK